MKIAKLKKITAYILISCLSLSLLTACSLFPTKKNIQYVEKDSLDFFADNSSERTIVRLWMKDIFKNDEDKPDEDHAYLKNLKKSFEEAYPQFRLKIKLFDSYTSTAEFMSIYEESPEEERPDLILADAQILMSLAKKEQLISFKEQNEALAPILSQQANLLAQSEKQKILKANQTDVKVLDKDGQTSDDYILVQTKDSSNDKIQLEYIHYDLQNTKLNDFLNKYNELIAASASKYTELSPDNKFIALGASPYLITWDKNYLENWSLADQLPGDENKRIASAEQFYNLIKVAAKKNRAIQTLQLYLADTYRLQSILSLFANLTAPADNNFNNADKHLSLSFADVNTGLQNLYNLYEDNSIGLSDTTTAKVSNDSFKQGVVAVDLSQSAADYWQNKHQINTQVYLSAFPRLNAADKNQSALDFQTLGLGIKKNKIDNSNFTKALAQQCLFNFLVNNDEWRIKNLKASGYFSCLGDKISYNDPNMTFAASVLDSTGHSLLTADNYDEFLENFRQNLASLKNDEGSVNIEALGEKIK